MQKEKREKRKKKKLEFKIIPKIYNSSHKKKETVSQHGTFLEKK